MSERSKNELKVAIVHDWLPLIGGAEKVLAQILKIYPEAKVFTLFNFLNEKELETLGIKNVTASSLNKLPGVKKYYRKLLSFFPMAIESFDLSEFDLIISSSSSVAKGVITGADQVHISYVHSPARYAWDLTHYYLKQTNLDKGIKGYLAKKMLHKFRLWDYRTANGVDQYIANSNYIKRRIWKVYRREADVIYPPVDIEDFICEENKEDFYFTASRMVPYKRLDLIADAFVDMPDKKLIIIGDGPEMEKIQKISNGAKNITLMGYQNNSILREYMQNAKAFVFAAEEDFGIIPVEAQASGTPVIAFGKGGATETVINFSENPNTATGVLFSEQNKISIINAVTKFEEVNDNITSANCRANAEKFSNEVFRTRLKNFVENTLNQNFASK